MKNKKAIIGVLIFVFGTAFVVSQIISNKKITSEIPGLGTNSISTTNATGTPVTLVAATYDTSAQTLKRLGFASITDVEKLSDGKKNNDTKVQELKKELAILDTSTNDIEIIKNSFFIAVNLDQLGQKDTAIKQYEYVLTKQSNHPTAINNLAVIYTAKGNYPKAEVYMKQLIALAPSESAHYTNLADVYRAFMKDKKSEIPALIQKGIDNNADKVSLTLYLADYYKQEGDFTKSVEWYKKALVLKPTSEEIKEALSVVENKL
jgi:tetratricopeptide (TPR) repeat protein